MKHISFIAVLLMGSMALAAEQPPQPTPTPEVEWVNVNFNEDIRINQCLAVGAKLILRTNMILLPTAKEIVVGERPIEDFERERLLLIHNLDRPSLFKAGVVFTVAYVGPTATQLLGPGNTRIELRYKEYASSMLMFHNFNLSIPVVVYQ